MAIPADFAEDLVRGQKTISSSVMAQLILAFQKSIQVPENDTVIDNLYFSPLIDRHDTLFDVFNSDIIQEEFDGHISQFGYHKIKQTPFHSDSLTYDFTNSSGITFDQPDQNNGTKFGGAAIADGSSFIVIPHDPVLEIDQVIITCWAYLKVSATGSRIISQHSTITYSLDLENSVVTFEGENNSHFKLEHTITSDGWYHIVCTATNGTQSLYINKILVASDTTTGNLRHETFSLDIFATNNDTRHMENGEGLAWLSVIDGSADQNWVNNDYDGIRDLTGRDEIISFPFVQNLKPQPPFTSGTFRSHTP